MSRFGHNIKNSLKSFVPMTFGPLHLASSNVYGGSSYHKCSISFRFCVSNDKETMDFENTVAFLEEATKIGEAAGFALMYYEKKSVPDYR